MMLTQSFRNVVLLCVLVLAPATQVRGETIQQLWAKVAAAHPRIKGAQARIELARSREAQARAAFYPRLGVQYDYARARNESLRVIDAHTTQQADAFLRLNLFNGFADMARRDSARNEMGASQEDYVDAREEIALALAEQYISVMTLSGQVANAKQLVDDLGLLLETVRAAVRLGRNPESDLIQATTKVLEGRANLSDVAGRLAGARARLSALVGMPVGDLTVPYLDEQMFSRSLSQLMSVAREGAPQLLAARARVQQANDEVGVARGELYPKINLEARKNIQRDGPAELVSGLEREALVQFTYEYSLGKAPYRRLDEARTRQWAAAEALREIEVQIESEMGDTREVLLEQAGLTPHLLERQRAAMGVFDAYRWQFNAGRRSLLDLITVREDQYISAEAVIANQRNRLLGAARLYRLLGQLTARLQDPAPRPGPVVESTVRREGPTSPGGSPTEELPLKLDLSPIQR